VAKIGGFNGEPTLTLSDDNLLDGVAPTVSITGDAIDDLKNFKNLSPAAVVGLIQPIGASLQNVAKGLNPSGGIPFVGDALNRAVNFSDMVTGMTLGLFDVNLAGSSAYTAANPLAAKLSTEARFKLSVVDTTNADASAQVVASKEIVIPAGVYTLAMLATAIKAQFTTAFAGKADVKDDGARIRFEAVGAGRTVTLRFAANSVGMQEIGFEPSLTNAVFKFDSVQSLTPLLGQAMGIDESVLNLDYNAVTRALEVRLKFNRAFTKTVDLDFNDAVDLGVGELALAGGMDATVSATANLDVTLGMKFAPELVTFPATYSSDVFPIYVKDGGTVSATATFKGTGDLSAALGILELGIDGAAADFNVKGSFTLKEPASTPSDGVILAGEFLKAGAINVPTFTAGGKVTLPLAVSGGADVGMDAPAGAKVVLNFLGSPTVKLSPDVTGVSDFVKRFTNFSTQNVFEVLKQLVGFVQNSEIKLFNQPLPLVNKSIKDLLAFADRIVNGLDGSIAAVKNLKSAFFNGGKTTKVLIQGVADAIKDTLIARLQTVGGEAANAGVRLKQAKDQLLAALGSLSADVQLSANLVSAMGLVVQSVAQLKSIPTLPSDVTPLLGTLDAALDPIRDVLPKIQSLKNVIGGTPILSELNKLAGEGPELANRLLEAVDRLDEALSQLPDVISDGAAFRMPAAITGAMAELSRTLDEVGERVEALPAGPQKVVLGKALGQAREALGPIQKALPAVQRLVGFLIDALNLKSLVTDEMLTALQDKVIKGLNDAIGRAASVERPD
jgi:hypothetical protein